MDMFSAVILSTKKQACFAVVVEQGIIVRPLMIYQLQVMRLSEGLYRFEVFRVTYPDRQEGKGKGKPQCAKEAHYSQRFSSDADLRVFLDTHFSVDGWLPVEEEEE